MYNKFGASVKVEKQRKLANGLKKQVYKSISQ